MEGGCSGGSKERNGGGRRRAKQGRSWGDCEHRRRDRRGGAGVSSHRLSCPEDCVRLLKREDEQMEQVGEASLPALPRTYPTEMWLHPWALPQKMPSSFPAHLYRGCSDVSEGDRSGMERDVDDKVVAMEAVVASSKEGGVHGKRSGRPVGMRQWAPSGARPPGLSCRASGLYWSLYLSPTFCSPPTMDSSSCLLLLN